MTWFQALERTVSGTVAKSTFLPCSVIERAGVCTRIDYTSYGRAFFVVQKSENRLSRSSLRRHSKHAPKKCRFLSKCPRRRLLTVFLLQQRLLSTCVLGQSSGRANAAHSTLAAEIRTYGLPNPKNNGMSTPNEQIH